MASNFTGLAKEVGRWLNDLEEGYPHIRWTEADLIEYANDAILQISNARPDLFVKTKEITLTPGTVQTLGEQCEQLVDILGTVGPNGSLLKARATKSDDNLDKWFGCEPVCSVACGQTNEKGEPVYSVSSFSFTKDDKSFTVQPPVPATPPVKIKAQCFSVPAAGGGKDAVPLDHRWHNAVIEWMRYRALSVDEESAPSFTRAQFHLKHFYEMLGLSRNAMYALVGKRIMNVEPPVSAA